MVLSATGEGDGKEATFPGSVLPQVDPRKLLEPEASDDDNADDDCISITAMCGDNHIPTADRLHNNERTVLENIMEHIP